MAHSLYEMDIRLRDISPPIWRTVELAGASTLEQLHAAVQVAMGWSNSHLHQFMIGKRSYGRVDVDESEQLEDECGVRLEDVAKQGDVFGYAYDFGDGWEHEITIKRVTSVAKPPRPRCTAGERACPPEDCGGPLGYEELVDALANRSHARHRELAEWANGWKPEQFAVPKAGRDLQREIDELEALAEEEADDADAELLALPQPLVEAVLALEPMQRASLVALIAGSLAQELEQVSAAAAQLVEGMKRQHKPARTPRKRARS